MQTAGQPTFTKMLEFCGNKSTMYTLHSMLRGHKMKLKILSTGPSQGDRERISGKVLSAYFLFSLVIKSYDIFHEEKLTNYYVSK